MPVQPTYPGVYIQEISSGVRTISGVATSIAAFVGFFRKGPMNEAVEIFNFGDFERNYGGLDIQSEASYAIQQFFLNGGGHAHVVRVASGSFAAASVEIGVAPAGAPTLSIQAQAIHAGAWGSNIRVFIDHDTPEASEFNLTVTELAVRTGAVLRQEKFRNLSLNPSSVRRNFIQDVINDTNTGSKIIRIPNVTATLADIPAMNGTVSGDIADATAIDLSVNPTVVVAIDGGAAINLSLMGPVTPTMAQLALALENGIRAGAPDNPILANAKVNAIGNQLQVLAGGNNPETLLTFSGGISGDLELSGADVRVNLQAYPLATVAAANTAQGTVVVGADGNLPDATALIGSLNSKTGMFALEGVDLFNILCIPRTGMTSGTNAMTTTQADAVISAAQAYCTSKRAFMILDTPLGIDELPEIKSYIDARGNLRVPNAALYYPRVRIPDPLDNFRLRSVGASGTIAGLYARTDNNRGVWKAPAGTEASLVNVPELTDILTDAENGVLNQIGVNCLRSKPVYGNISWGARTLVGADQMASESKYVPVRRFTLFLEESLFRGTQWVVFEPNDESLWAQIRLNIGAFMNNLFKQGAFQGTSPKEAYMVKCDASTTTQNDIDQGIVNIVVGFAPLKPAEFVIISIQQLAGQIQA